ncbi:hypothetical protein BTVI_97052 [Pitangus sulphuratus]|nr:hypothetical protein BTVI_97052 [Pitangus sulphuratus]
MEEKGGIVRKAQGRGKNEMEITKEMKGNFQGTINYKCQDGWGVSLLEQKEISAKKKVEFDKVLLILGLALTQAEDFEPGLVEIHELLMGLLLQPEKVPLGGIPSLLPSLMSINCTSQHGGIRNLSEGALNPTVYAAVKDMK